MNRRSFLSTLGAVASGLLLPHEPKRVYSFLPRERGPVLGDGWHRFGITWDTMTLRASIDGRTIGQSDAPRPVYFECNTLGPEWVVRFGDPVDAKKEICVENGHAVIDYWRHVRNVTPSEYWAEPEKHQERYFDMFAKVPAEQSGNQFTMRIGYI